MTLGLIYSHPDVGSLLAIDSRISSSVRSIPSADFGVKLFKIGKYCGMVYAGIQHAMNPIEELRTRMEIAGGMESKHGMGIRHILKAANDIFPESYKEWGEMFQGKKKERSAAHYLMSVRNEVTKKFELFSYNTMDNDEFERKERKDIMNGTLEIIGLEEKTDDRIIYHTKILRDRIMGNRTPEYVYRKAPWLREVEQKNKQTSRFVDKILKQYGYKCPGLGGIESHPIFYAPEVSIEERFNWIAHCCHGGLSSYVTDLNLIEYDWVPHLENDEEHRFIGGRVRFAMIGEKNGFKYNAISINQKYDDWPPESQ